MDKFILLKRNDLLLNIKIRASAKHKTLDKTFSKIFLVSICRKAKEF